MTITPWTSADFLGTLRTLRPVSSYFLDLCFPRVYTSTTEFIDIADIPEARRILAPLVMPTTGGRPVYNAAEEARRFKPAYVKPKDAVNAASMASRQAGLGELFNPTPMSPAERFDAVVARIVQMHRDTVFRRLEWLAARAIIDGTVTLEDEGYPNRTVTFGRAASQDVTLGTSATWDNANADILGDVQDWLNIAATQRTLGNGPLTRMTVGANVAKALQTNDAILKLMSTLTNQYGGGVNVNLGINQLDANTQTVYLGRLTPTLEVYQNSDWYLDPDTLKQTPFLDPDEIVLTGDVQGIKAFGAIMDKAAQFQNTPIFMKMFDQDDPSATVILTQSAPLAIPLYPNATFRAKVLAS